MFGVKIIMCICDFCEQFGFLLFIFINAYVAGKGVKWLNKTPIYKFINFISSNRVKNLLKNRSYKIFFL